MRCTFVVLVALLAMASGCGGEDGEVEDTVDTFIGAVAEGDGSEACEHMTNGARRDLLGSIAESTLIIALPECEDLGQFLAEHASQRLRDRLEALEVGDVRVNGDRASAQLVVDDEPMRTLELERRDGAWLIADGFRFQD
jgi:hypothetical protein